MIRTFVAIEVSQSVRARAAELARRLRQAQATVKVSWVGAGQHAPHVEVSG